MSFVQYLTSIGLDLLTVLAVVAMAMAVILLAPKELRKELTGSYVVSMLVLIGIMLAVAVMVILQSAWR